MLEYYGREDGDEYGAHSLYSRNIIIKEFSPMSSFVTFSDQVKVLMSCFNPSDGCRATVFSHLFPSTIFFVMVFNGFGHISRVL